MFGLLVMLVLCSALSIHRYSINLSVENIFNEYSTVISHNNVNASSTSKVSPPSFSSTATITWVDHDPVEIDIGKIQIFHPQIENIRLLAERHSGSTYLTRYLQACFPKHPVKDFLVRGKHWFQPTPETIVEATQTLEREALAAVTTSNKFDSNQRTWRGIAAEPEPRQAFQTSLVLLVVRDPYQWMEAMRLRPWHWPNHLRIEAKNETTVATMKYKPNKRRGRQLQHRRTTGIGDDTVRGDIDLPATTRQGGRLPAKVQIQKSFVDHFPLDWDEFVHRPMYLLDEDSSWQGRDAVCQKGYLLGTVSPCVQNHSYVPPTLQHIPRSFLRNLPLGVNDVVYELNRTGVPFAHPLELRSAKLQNGLNLPNHWDLGGFALLRYEDLLNGMDNGTILAGLVEDLARALGTTGSNSTCPEHTVLPKVPYTLNPNYTQWINEYADWKVEGRLGYSRQSP